MQGQLKLLGITCIFCAYFGSAPIADPRAGPIARSVPVVSRTATNCRHEEVVKSQQP